MLGVGYRRYKGREVGIPDSVEPENGCAQQTQEECAKYESCNVCPWRNK